MNALVPLRQGCQRIRAQAGRAARTWAALTRRDQRLMLGMAASLSAALLWLLALQPALGRIDHWQQELPRLRAQARTLQDLLATVPVTAVGADWPKAVSDSLDRQGLQAHYTLSAEPGRPGHWRLQLDDAPAGATLTWLLHGAPAFSLTISQAQLQRQGGDSRPGSPGDGRLSGTVRMVQAPVAKEAS